MVERPNILVIWGDDIGIIDRGCLVLAAQALVIPFLATFKDFPPRQRAARFTIDQALERWRRPPRPVRTEVATTS
jgi:hypothetical protein